MAFERIIRYGDSDFSPHDSSVSSYLSVSSFVDGDDVSVKFKSDLVNARQTVFLKFYQGLGPALINRDTGSDFYRLEINKPDNTDPNLYPVNTGVEFYLYRNGTLLLDPVLVDVGEHDWLGIRFSTRDTVQENRVFLSVQFSTDRNGAWSQAFYHEDEYSDLWRSSGKYGWALDHSVASPTDYFISSWVIQRYNTDRNDLFYVGNGLVYIPEYGFVDSYTNLPLQFPILDSFEDSSWDVVDYDLPEIQITTDPGAASLELDPVTFEYVGSDPNPNAGFTGEVVGYEYKFDEQNFVFTEDTTLVIPYEHFGLGEHTFYVRALDQNNNSSYPFASHTWTTVPYDPNPPTTTIVSGPENGSFTFRREATFTFTGTDDNFIIRFEYQIDSGGWNPLGFGITSVTIPGLTYGPHTFEVRAVDASLNVDPSPPSVTWTVHDFSQVSDLVHWLDFTDQSALNGPSTTYVEAFTSPTATWTITHNLDSYPNVTTVDTLGNVVYGDVSYIDRDTVQVIFSIPQDGSAYLNRGSLEFTQSVASSTWTINHNSVTYPEITTKDSSRNVIYGNVSYPNTNTAVVTFSSPKSGYAYLNYDETTVHTQAVAASTWTISHNLDDFPSITTVGNSYNAVLGTVQYVDANTVEVTFSSAVSGYAFLNSTTFTTGTSILSASEKSPASREFTAVLGQSAPIWVEDALTTAFGDIGAALFRPSDFLRDSALNATISGDDLTFGFIADRIGSTQNLVSFTGAADIVSFGMTYNTSAELEFNTSLGEKVSVPYVESSPVFFFVRLTGGFADIFVNGSLVATHGIDPAWTLGASVSDILLGSPTSSLYVYHVAMYDRALSDVEIDELSMTYEEITPLSSVVFYDSFAGLAGTSIDARSPDVGSNWTITSGGAELDGSGAAEVVSPSTFASAPAAGAGSIIVFEDITLLEDSDNHQIIFREDSSDMGDTYYTLVLYNQTTGTDRYIALRRYIAGAVQPIIELQTLPWGALETVGPDGFVNIMVGISEDGLSLSFGGGLSELPTLRSNGLTPFTGNRYSEYVLANVPAASGTEVGVGFKMAFTGMKVGAVKVIEL